MKTKTLFIVFLSAVIIMIAKELKAQEIRPIRDSVGFCWNPSEMNRLMNYLKTGSNSEDKYPAGYPVAAISPHDDYLYAGRVYYPLYHLIKAKEVVIFGVTHGTVRKALNDPKNILIMDDYKYWHGPYSNVEISPLREIIKTKLQKNYYITNDKAQCIEHSIEALVPFLQYYNRHIKITPIMVTAMSFERMNEISGSLSEIISGYMKKNGLEPGKDIFFLISTDANHYGVDFDNSHYGLDLSAHNKATKNDVRVADKYFSGILTKEKIKEFAEELWGKTDKYTPLWCGKYSIPFGLLTATKIIKETTGKNLSGFRYKYSDSWTEGVIPIKRTGLGLTAPFSLRHWVGYLSEGFYLK